MARYIDAEHLFKCETCRHHRSGGCDTWCENGECYSPDMSKIPTADVTEVVRCKDCKHRFVPGRCALWYATVGKDDYFAEHGDDFYCAYGERKENV